MAKRKLKKSNILIIAVFLIFFSLILTLLINGYKTITMGVVKTHIIDLGEVNKTINKNVVIIRKSSPVISKRSGILTTFYNQGERVPKNAVICKVQDSYDTNNEIANLERINTQIEQLKNTSSFSSNLESSLINNDINYLYLNIQEKIKNNDLNSLSKLKIELSSLLQKKTAYDQGSTNQISLQDLYNQKTILEKKLFSDNTYIKSDLAGEISYYFDDNEKLFSYDNMNKLKVSDILKVNNSFRKIDKNSIKNGDIIGYIVDNHNYFMATEIEKSDIESIKRDVKLTFLIDNIYINSYFYDFYKDSDGKFVGLFKVESEDFDFLKNRKENVDIIYDHAKGLLIPNTAIVDYNHKRGVFVVNEIGIAKFNELNSVLISDDKNTILQFSYDDLNDETKINLYDEIILSPKNIKDGQKVR